MILAVTGYRYYKDQGFIWNHLSMLKPVYESSAMGFLHIRVGDADGADRMVRKWCEANSVSHHVFYANWGLGTRAGPQRNERMLLGQGDPITGPTNLLLAFPRTDGVRIRIPGSGTWGCTIRASELGIGVEIPPYTRNVKVP